MNILSLSYGKDSLACIGACELLGWKIDRIVHAEVWATDTIPADLPPMVEFKAKADKIIKDRLGIEVEHLCAMRGGGKQVTNISSINNLIATSAEEKYTDSQCQLVHGAIADLKPTCSTKLQKVTYQDLFYRVYQKGARGGRYKDFQSQSIEGSIANNSKQIYGFPMIKGQWCNSELKMPPLNFQNLVKARWCNI